MTALPSAVASSTRGGDVLAALDRWLTERNAYDAQVRARVATHFCTTGMLPTGLIRPEDVAELESILRVASWLASGPTRIDGELVPSPSAVPWDVFAQEALAMYSPSLRSKGTLYAMQHTCRMLESLGVKSTSDLTIQLIARVVTTRAATLSPNRVRGILRHVSALCTHAVNFGYLRRSPFVARPIRTWVKASQPQSINAHLTRGQVRAILDLAAREVQEKQGWPQWNARRTQALVNLVAGSGLRLGEAIHAHAEDLDLDQGIVFVVSRSTHRLKTAGAETFVPLTYEAIKTLRDWLAHRLDAPDGFDRKPSPYLFPSKRTDTPWVSGSTGYKPLCCLKALAERAGVEGASYQKLRRTVATMLEEVTSTAMIQRVLRHTTASTTQTYYMKRDIENMTKAMSRLEY